MDDIKEGIQKCKSTLEKFVTDDLSTWSLNPIGFRIEEIQGSFHFFRM